MTVDERITARVAQALKDRVFPGCEVGYIRDGRSVVLPFGGLTYAPQAEPVTPQTLYDVASVTKSVPTSSIILKFIEDGRLSLDDQAIRYLPELRNQYRDQILIRHLLTYSVVFDFPKGLSLVAKTAPGDILHKLFTTELLAAPGEKYVYTNPPAILLGLIAEKVLGQPLDRIARDMFFEPLGMRHTTFKPQSLGPTAQVAPAERDFRGEVQGIPHDETAWALRRSGVTAGHAGLFSTAGDQLRFASMLLNEGELDGRRYFQPATVQLMHTNQISHLAESTALGWELNWPHVMGNKASTETFGKTGFTGCLVLVDPIKQAALVHLSNSAYPTRPTVREPINALRRDLADIVFGP